MEAALKEIKALSLHGTVTAYCADFSKMSDVYDFVDKIKSDFDKVDVFFNNAGLYAITEREATAENIELTFMLSFQVPLKNIVKRRLENSWIIVIRLIRSIGKAYHE
ncbi:SDR family NAD(P)-dependent oxidoreductase [Enterococcus faecium]|uniref:SDR family NAD(P)-dependent oxidoreductase n=1 Tax=Enterococcus faecium TaxID=1352 RepID=UPI00351ED6AC